MNGIPLLAGFLTSALPIPVRNPVRGGLLACSPLKGREQMSKQSPAPLRLLITGFEQARASKTPAL